TDTVMVGEGSVDMRDEKLALKLKPKPKDLSPVTLRSPLRIAGTLGSPTVFPEPAPIAARLAAAAALYVLAPPAALLALVETGPGKDTDCGASIHKP
ncbi:MAG TPA: AsmA family protein, partial [Burkholderiales bacterium]|nr:AsmA family protein [Burkholderiales bacterium]